MFPWHEDTAAFLALAILGGMCALFASARRRWRWRPCAALCLVAAIWPWPLTLAVGLDGYVIESALYLSIGTVLAVVMGGICGLGCRWIDAKSARRAAAILPALLAAGWVLERQRVPDAPCAQRAVFRIGDQTLAIPRAMGARSVRAGDAPEQAWQGNYSDWTGDKPAVRALCQATSGGRNVMAVSHLWLSVSGFRKHHQADCERGGPPEKLAAYCEAVARTRLTVVQLYARPDGLPHPSLSHFPVEAVVDALKGGEMAGVRCDSPVGADKQRHCTVWQPVSPEVLAVAAAVHGPPLENEAALADAAAELAAVIARLRTTGSL